MTRINHRIRVPEVLLIDVDGTQIGVVETRKAQLMAKDKGLDLVEVASSARPPVCRIMDYGKFKYEQGKKERGSKRAGSSRVKEIKFHANVGEHDYMTKVRRAHTFLGEGHRVKCSLYFRGRENDHREFGFEVMKRVKQDCLEYGTAEHEPRMMGRNLIMMIAPNKNRPASPPKDSAAAATGDPASSEGS